MLCVVPIVHLANEIVRAGTRQGTAAASAQPRHPKPACDGRRRRRRRRRDQARPPASSPHHEQPNDRPRKRDLVRKAATKLRSLFRRSHGSSVVSTAPSSSCASTVDTVNLPTLFTHPPSSVPQPKTPLALSLTDIYYGPVLGRGALGTVRLATVTPEDDAVASRTEDAPRFALKILNKEVVYAKRAVANVLAEKEALNTIPSHPAIMQLHGSFNDAHNLYLLTEFLPGGELLAAMCDGLMCLRQAQFHTACIVLGLQHIHAHQFVYRDLKPENLVFGHDGYLKFVDFGLAKKLPDIHTPSGRQQARTMTRCGTPNYMAPEVLAGSGYNRAADLWSLGILLYEMFVGRTPFAATDDDGYEEEDVGFRKLRANLVRKAATNHRMRFPQRVHDRFPEACDLVDRLLQADPERRIGMRDARELRQHSFFYGLDWDALRDKRLKSPHIAAPLHNDVDSERDDRGQADQDGKSVYVSEFVRIEDAPVDPTDVIGAFFADF